MPVMLIPCMRWQKLLLPPALQWAPIRALPTAIILAEQTSVLPPEQIYELVIYQLGALDAFLRVMNARLHHVKPHGALYNMAAKDATMAEAICKAVFDYDSRLVLYGLSGSKLIEAATASGLTTCSEVFADRTYQDDGHLTTANRCQCH